MYHIQNRQVHLDFHTSALIEGIGSQFDPEQLRACLQKAHLQSITFFAKCHHGVGYFPSKTIPMHPHLKFDLLSAQRKICAEEGIESPIYISAGFDEHYFMEHPDHMRICPEADKLKVEVAEKDGVKYAVDRPRYHELCMNTPYLDYLVKQIQEVVEKFQPCGIILDIVGEHVCYCENCRASVRELGWDENDSRSYEKLARIVYKKYYQATNGAARAIKPDIRLYHNSGHTTRGRYDLMAINTHQELESLPTGGWGYDHFPLSVRYVCNFPDDYMGITGKFHTGWGEFGGYKHPNALKYEIAMMLANGAKCSIGDQMHPYGFLDEATYELIGMAYGYAEEVDPYCYDIQPVADIGVLSIEALTEGRDRKSVHDIGASRMMLEGHYLYDLLDCESDFGKYKVLILPDKAGNLSKSMQKKLRTYVDNGGKVLCTGVSGTDEAGKFIFNMGVGFGCASAFNPCYYYPSYPAMGLSPTSYVIYGQMYNVSLTDENAVVLGYCQEPFFNRKTEHFCSHRHAPTKAENCCPAAVIGKEGAYIAYEVFFDYAQKGSYVLKDMVYRTLDTLLGDQKTVNTNLPSGGKVVLNRQNQYHRDVLHALYATPVRRGDGIEVIEDLPAMVDTTFEVVTDPVKKAVLVPQNREVPFAYENGVCKLTIDKFTCHQIVVLEH